MIPQSCPDSSPSFPPKQFAKVYTNELAEVCSQCTRAELAVYIALKAHIEDGNPEKGCWPGRPLLSEITGLSLPRISRATTGLERKGFIIKIHDGPHPVDYFINTRSPAVIVIETAPIPPVAPVDECPKQHGGVSKTARGGVQNSTTEQTREPTRKDKRAAPPAEPAAPTPAPETPNGAHSGFVIQIRTSIADDWALPDDYRTWATEHRPDLADRLDGIADGFRDYHLSKGTRSANWQAEWRRWIHRERAPKPTQNVPAATQTERRYPTVEQEKALDEANLAAMRASDARRIAQLIANGIDPLTGLKARPPAPAAEPEQEPPASLEAASPQPAPLEAASPIPTAPEPMPARPIPIPAEIRNRFNPTASHAPPTITREQTATFAQLAAAGKSLSEIRALLGLAPTKSPDSSG